MKYLKFRKLQDSNFKSLDLSKISYCKFEENKWNDSYNFFDIARSQHGYHLRLIVTNEVPRSKKIITDLYFFKLQCIIGISIQFLCSSLKEKFIWKSFKFMAPSIDTSNISKTEISWISVQRLRNYERNKSTSRRVIVGDHVSWPIENAG